MSRAQMSRAQMSGFALLSMSDCQCSIPGKGPSPGGKNNVPIIPFSRTGIRRTPGARNHRLNVVDVRIRLLSAFLHSSRDCFASLNTSK